MSVTISSNRPLPNRNSLKHEEDLINAFEYEEERITNSLFSKLEQLRSEKVQLENTLEVENEAVVNRLNRQIAALQQAQSDQPHHASSPNSHFTASQSENHPELTPLAGEPSPLTPMRATSQSVLEPSTATIIEALRRENDSLRRRLTDTERDYIRVTRMNDTYREELIQHRTRLGMPVDSLIGLSGPSVSNSPILHSAPLAAITATTAPVPMGVPIPHSNSSHQPQRHSVISSSASPSSASTETSTTTTSPSSSLPPSPFTFSPPTTTLSTNFRHSNWRPRATSDAHDQDVAFSNGTQLTTPPSSNNSPFALQLPAIHQPHVAHVGAWGLGPRLTYPSAPPPSLSSSLGSPIISRRNSVHTQYRAPSPPPASPTTPSVQEGSTGEGAGGRHGDGDRATPEPGNSSASTPSAGTNVTLSSLRRLTSVERGARVAETGSLVPRRRESGSRGRGGSDGGGNGDTGGRRPAINSRGTSRARRGVIGPYT